MVYNILSGLERQNKLYVSSLTISKKGTINNKAFLFGREITSYNSSGIKYRGGESGYEELTIPIEDVLEIVCEGKTVFKKRPRIKKVNPR